MQAASDIFLGWQRRPTGSTARRDFYVRQLRDWKGSVDVEEMAPTAMAAVRRAVRLDAGPGPRPLRRPRSRSPPTSAASDVFDRALAEFAERLRRPERARLRALLKAVDAGRLEAVAA